LPLDAAGVEHQRLAKRSLRARRYSYGAVNGAHAADELAKPVENTLFFAGEATHAGMSGTVAGALASGIRAAKEISGGGDSGKAVNQRENTDT
jgi:predicted NAD/FAD-dependent oxidoreductase